MQTPKLRVINRHLHLHIEKKATSANVHHFSPRKEANIFQATNHKLAKNLCLVSSLGSFWAIPTKYWAGKIFSNRNLWPELIQWWFRLLKEYEIHNLF